MKFMDWKHNRIQYRLTEKYPPSNTTELKYPLPPLVTSNSIDMLSPA